MNKPEAMDCWNATLVFVSSSPKENLRVGKCKSPWLVLLCARMLLAAFPLALAFAAAAVGEATTTLWFVTSDDANDLLTLCAARRRCPPTPSTHPHPSTLSAAWTPTHTAA